MCENDEHVRSLNELTAHIRQRAHTVKKKDANAVEAFKKKNLIGEELLRALDDINVQSGVSSSIAQAKEYVEKVIETRTCLQSIETFIQFFLDDKLKEKEFEAKFCDYACHKCNMYEPSELANASKQMIAYGHSIDTIIPRLNQLSIVASEFSVSLMEMVGRYNTIKDIGFLDARGIKSWEANGFSVTDVLKKMGEKVEKDKVPLEQFDRVLDYVTGNEGIFHNIADEQIKTISAERVLLEGTLSNFYDAIEVWYRDDAIKSVKNVSNVAGSPAEKFERVLDSGTGTADYILDHLKETASVIEKHIVTYGAYMAAVITVNAVQNVKNRAFAQGNKRLEDFSYAINQIKKAIYVKDTPIITQRLGVLTTALIFVLPFIMEGKER